MPRVLQPAVAVVRDRLERPALLVQSLDFRSCPRFSPPARPAPEPAHGRQAAQRPPACETRR